jgi:hypothetical protein
MIQTRREDFKKRYKPPHNWLSTEFRKLAPKE